MYSRSLPIVRIGTVVAIMVECFFLGASLCEAAEPTFEHGELIIGYASPNDREQAIQELNNAQRRLRVRGENIGDLKLESLGTSALKVHIQLPLSVRGQATSDSAFELKLLRETAGNIQKSDKRVLYAHPNWILTTDQLPRSKPIDVQALDNLIVPESLPTSDSPNDYAFVRGLQWDYSPLPVGMNAIGAWKTETGSREVVVAVVDTGVVSDHPDIRNSGNLLQGYSFVTEGGRRPDPTDPGEPCVARGETGPSWHGTHVAGTIGAVESNNARGITGINWKVSVLPVRAIGGCGGALTDIAAGLLWAAGLPVQGVPINPHPAHVINMSLGGSLPCTEESAGLLRHAISEARAAGSVVVVSAGNNMQDASTTIPGGCPGVVSVAASSSDGHLAWYSNYGNVTVMAPGGDLDAHVAGYPAGIWSTIQVSQLNREGIEPDQGTSMAAPHVSAAIALALSHHPDWRGKPDLIEQRLRASARIAIDGACPNSCGNGQIDAAKLIEGE